MKKKLSVKVIMSLILSAVLFCMPIGAFMANSGNTVSVQAQDTDAEENESETETPSTGNEEESESEQESSTVSGNDIPTPECACKEKCSQYSVDKECEVCKEDYSLCEYVNPNVKITINTPTGWHNDTTKVPVLVEDVAKSGNFTVKSVQAKVAQNGSWTDITEDMYVEISENCTVYVLVTDQKGNTYEKNRYIKCFDFTKPTLNAAVSDGLLSVQAHDTDSGIKAVYVNGYEFTELTNGVLNIRLQQFDAGYQYFTISAMDNAGNMSEVYKTANPYYTDPEAEDSNESNPAEQLPVSAEATKPSSATGQVTEHTKTDSEGNTTSETSLAEQKKAAMQEADASEQAENNAEQSEKGKEFYTIQTASDKVFYLIIDRDGDEEMVYFLTEISENDLLNTTTENSETLPKNSAALESAIPVSDGALPNNNTETDTEGTEELPEDGEESMEEGTEEPEEEQPAQTDNPMGTYIVLGIIAVIGIGAGYYFKVVKKKKEQYFMAHILCGGVDAATERIDSKTEAEQIAGACRNGQALVTSVVKEEKTVASPKLYDLTTLQRDANRLFGFTAKQTLEYTQSLYEKKLCTYPRTDSQYLSDDMEQTAGNVIKAIFSSILFEENMMFNPDIKRVLNSKKVTDHHAIIPTMEIAKADLAALPETERKILSLVANRLLCATGEKHLYETVKAELTCGGYTLSLIHI